MSRMSARLVCATAAALVLAVGCKDTITGPGNAVDVEARLFAAMNTDDFAAAGDIVGQLYELRDQHPENHRNTFLLGGASLWWLAEAGHPGANPLMITGQAVPLILESFVDVILNDPVNGPGAKALLGAFLSDGGFDKVQGAALVEEAVASKPVVGLFQRMHIRRFAFADDAETELAVNAGFDFWKLCAGTAIDRANPDFTTLVRPPTSDDNARFCWGSARVPHGFEGAWLIFGDLLVKSGRIAAGRRAYLNARLGPNYDRWRYKSEIEQRLASDLDARHATYSSRYVADWATIGVPTRSCTQCHASVAK